MPSSLTRVFPRTLGFSPRLPVSVSGTGGLSLARSFSWQYGIREFRTISCTSLSCLEFRMRGFPSAHLYALRRALPSARSRALLRHSITQSTLAGTGLSTCCPSPTRLCLGLGPDLPWDDDRCPGTLRLSVERILTFLFDTHTGILSSCQSTAPYGTASPRQERSPTHLYLNRCHSFGSVLEPRSSSAQRLSTSELLRTL